MAAKDFIIFILSSACGSIVARKSIYSQNTSLTNSWIISMCFPGGFDSRSTQRSATACYQKSLMENSMRDHTF